eukprot:6490093-Lingulodinium_polyedra.AAC.1
MPSPEKTPSYPERETIHFTAPLNLCGKDGGAGSATWKRRYSHSTSGPDGQEHPWRPSSQRTN